jgi:hypothetical protein
VSGLPGEQGRTGVPGEPPISVVLGLCTTGRVVNLLSLKTERFSLFFKLRFLISFDHLAALRILNSGPERLGVL